MCINIILETFSLPDVDKETIGPQILYIALTLLGYILKILYLFFKIFMNEWTEGLSFLFCMS